MPVPQGDNVERTQQKGSEAAEVFARLAADPNAHLVEREAEVTFIGEPADNAADE